mgnify:CR=1 FL=1
MLRTLQQASTRLNNRTPHFLNKLSRASSCNARPVSTVSFTQTSVLPNGITVASEHLPNTSSATVGVFVDAGSRAENVVNNGTAHFLEHLTFKGTARRSQEKIELDIENIGSHLNAYTSRENTVYYAKTLKEDISTSMDILSDILTKSVLDPKAIERERDVIIRESEEVDKMYDEVVFDHLHEIVFKDQPLGRTILGPIPNIKKITRKDLSDYIQTNYKGDRMVLVGTGAINHEDLVKYGEKYFGHLPKSSKVVPLGSPRGPLPVFNSAEKKLQDSTIPTTHIAIAMEGCSWSSPDYFTGLCTQAIIGNWDKAMGSGTNSPSPLAVAASTKQGTDGLANSYMSYSTSYCDTGLWGSYIVLDSQLHDPKKIIDEILNEWKRIKLGHINKDEFERAKAQLKASLLLSLDGSTPILEDIGRQIVTTGKRLTPEEVFNQVDKIGIADIVKWANATLNENKPISICSMGNTEKVPSLEHLKEGLKL